MELVADMQIVADAPGGADADDGLNAEEAEKLLGVQGEGGDAHAGAHDGNLLAFEGAGIAQHIPNVVEEDGVFQIVLRDELGAQRVAGHQDHLGHMGAGLEFNTGGRGRSHHECIPPDYDGEGNCLRPVGHGPVGRKMTKERFAGFCRALPG